jgi:hypothetical protein
MMENMVDKEKEITWFKTFSYYRHHVILICLITKEFKKCNILVGKYSLNIVKKESHLGINYNESLNPQSEIFEVPHKQKKVHSFEETHNNYM